MRTISRGFSTLGLLFLLILAWSGSPLLLGCANIVPPMGGPRDSLPPRLLQTSPADSTTNFAARKIELSFDEYVQLDNVFENVLVNPPLDRFPTIDGKLRTVTITIKDTLEENTTYSIDFGKAIKDVNEGNALKGFTYVFSTGPTIDSLEISGTVANAETGLADSSLIVILHSNMDDSAVAKEKPVYVTRLNGKGEFRFRYLPDRPFRVFALKDEGFKQYQDPATPFAFADSVVLPGRQDGPLELRFFTVPDSSEKAAPQAQPAPKLGGRKKDDEENAPKGLVYSSSAKGKQQDILSPLDIRFTDKIATWDTTRIRLTDTLFNPVATGSFQLDSMNALLPVDWKSSTPYVLVLEKGFAADSTGTTTPKNDTLRFSTKAESEYGAVRIRFGGIDLASKPLLYWIQNNTVVRKTPLTAAELRIALIEPGQYTLRIVLDDNGNGSWDTGNYWEKKQPERVIALPKDISIRANWDNEFQFDL